MVNVIIYVILPCLHTPELFGQVKSVTNISIWNLNNWNWSNKKNTTWWQVSCKGYTVNPGLESGGLFKWLNLLISQKRNFTRTIPGRLAASCWCQQRWCLSWVFVSHSFISMHLFYSKDGLQRLCLAAKLCHICSLWHCISSNTFGTWEIWW